MKDQRFEIVDLGILDYIKAWEIQKKCFSGLSENRGKETVFLLEHPNVYTLGRLSSLNEIKTCVSTGIKKPENIAREPDEKESFLIDGIPAYWVNRGGKITFHCPGQLIIYPIIAPKKGERDLDLLIGFFEKLIISICARYGIEGFCDASKRGVWTTRGKLASIGIGVKKWIIYHGIALNISADLSFFSKINPCGIDNCKLTNLNDLTDIKPSVNDIKKIIIEEFNKYWDIYWKNLLNIKK